MQFIADTSHHIMSSLSQLTCTNSIHRQKVYQFAHNFNLSHALCQDVYYIMLRVNKCHKKERRFWMNNFSLFSRLNYRLWLWFNHPLRWWFIISCFRNFLIFCNKLLLFYSYKCSLQTIYIPILAASTWLFRQLQLDYFDSFNLLVSVAASYLSL